MQYAKWLNHRTTMGIFGVFLLAGLLPTDPYIQLVSADTQPVNAQNYSLWGTMGKVEDSDTQPVELGIKFRTDVDGNVSAVRFYRAVPVDSGYRGAAADSRLADDPSLPASSYYSRANLHCFLLCK